MATLDTATLDLTSRSDSGSRAMRRLRRTGRVPGILYGGDETPVPFEVDARILRNTLAHAGALLKVTVDGSGSQPVQIKDVQRHALRGDILHADFVRVDMDVAMQAPIMVEIVGIEHAPGVVQGGVLTQETTQIVVESLPGDMPEVIQFDASNMQIAETVHIGQIDLPQGVTLVDDPEHVLASITSPSEEIEETDEIETEVAVVGEEAQAQAEGDTAEEAEQKAEGGEGDGGEAA
jgi:large subunit ribosomal protein L25